MLWNEKQILRVKMRTAVRNLAVKASASKRIRHHLHNSAPWQTARTIFGFLALSGEPDWLGENLPSDKLLAFPKVSEDGKLEFFSGSTFQTGALGVREPEGGLAAQSCVEFGLYIPALAWPSFVLLGLAWGTQPDRSGGGIP